MWVRDQPEADKLSRTHFFLPKTTQKHHHSSSSLKSGNHVTNWLSSVIPLLGG